MPSITLTFTQEQGDAALKELTRLNAETGGSITLQDFVQQRFSQRLDEVIAEQNQRDRLEIADAVAKASADVVAKVKSDLGLS